MSSPCCGTAAPTRARCDTDLAKVGAAEELDLESERADGTLRDPVTMWVVRAGDHLYVRSVKGTAGPWYRGTQSRHQGRIVAGGVRRVSTGTRASSNTC
ncbi:DUF2255 family protein [Streptomyces sp. NPDC048277]|uniref:DUF2255 family protein n=1 Tax=Streptomyces sp. NPDC048277 TaxID=3155027 RepID=UPI0033E838CE